MEDCLFCKIVEKKIPSQIVFEDDLILAFKDINPKAKTHILIIPKKHIPSVNEVTEDDSELLGHLFLVVRKIAEERGFAKDGYRLSVNVGLGGGQEVFHLHIHLLSDK